MLHLIFISLLLGVKGDVCDVCMDKTIPTKNNILLNVYGMETPKTCMQLYTMGLNEEIDPPLCYPLQLYISRRCGCGVEPVSNVSKVPSNAPSNIPSNDVTSNAPSNYHKKKSSIPSIVPSYQEHSSEPTKQVSNGGLKVKKPKQ